MTKHRAAKTCALGHRGTDIVSRQIVHQAVLGHHRQHRECTGEVAEQGKSGVVREVLDFFNGPHLVEVGAYDAEERKPIHSSAEVHQQDGAQRKARDRVADEDEHR